MGETLPLFESAGFAGSEFGQPLHRAPDGSAQANLHRYAGQSSSEGDRHMHVAWHLSNALKAGKAGRRPDGTKSNLTATQKRQVGNAICEHLLASLREQVSAEATSG